MSAPDRQQVARSIADRIDWTPTVLAGSDPRVSIVEQVLRLAEYERPTPAVPDAKSETDRKIATVELRGLTACRCEAAWSDRGLHEPMKGCASEYREDVDLLAALALPTGREQ